MFGRAKQSTFEFSFHTHAIRRPAPWLETSVYPTHHAESGPCRQFPL